MAALASCSSRISAWKRTTGSLTGKSLVPIGNAPGGQNCSTFQAHRDRIHEAAAADAPRLHVSDHRSRASRHARATRARWRLWRRAFPCGWSRLQRPAPPPSRRRQFRDDCRWRSRRSCPGLPVPADPRRGTMPTARIPARMSDPTKPPEAALKANAAVCRQRPAQILRPKMLRTQMGGLEGHMRKWLDIEPGEQVMHHRVADQDHLGNLLVRDRAASFAIICRRASAPRWSDRLRTRLPGFGSSRPRQTMPAD